MPTARPDGVDREDARELRGDRDAGDDEQRSRVVPVAVDALVDGPRRRSSAELARERQERTASRRRTVREKKTTPATIVPTTKIASIQRYGADRVVADREQEADAREQERHRPADRPLEQDRARDRRDPARVAAGRLVDARCVAADARRQHLAPPRTRRSRCGSATGRDSCTPRAREQQLPAPRHRRHRDERQERREQEPGDARRAEDVRRLAEVDLVRGCRRRRATRRAASLRCAAGASSGQPLVDAAERRDRVADVVVRVRRRERQRQHLGAGALGDRQRRLVRRRAGRGTRSAGAPAGSGSTCRCSRRSSARCTSSRSANVTPHDVEVVGVHVAGIARDRLDRRRGRRSRRRRSRPAGCGSRRAARPCRAARARSTRARR